MHSASKECGACPVTCTRQGKVPLLSGASDRTPPRRCSARGAFPRRPCVRAAPRLHETSSQAHAREVDAARSGTKRHRVRTRARPRHRTAPSGAARARARLAVVGVGRGWTALRARGASRSSFGRHAGARSPRTSAPYARAMASGAVTARELFGGSPRSSPRAANDCTGPGESSPAVTARRSTTGRPSRARRRRRALRRHPSPSPAGR